MRASVSEGLPLQSLLSTLVDAPPVARPPAAGDGFTITEDGCVIDQYGMRVETMDELQTKVAITRDNNNEYSTIYAQIFKARAIA